MLHRDVKCYKQVSTESINYCKFTESVHMENKQHANTTSIKLLTKSIDIDSMSLDIQVKCTSITQFPVVGLQRIQTNDKGQSHIQCLAKIGSKLHNWRVS